jgi:hypothetical protein
VGVNQSQAPQGALSQRIVAEIGNDQPLFVTDDNVFHHTGPVDQNADLTPDVNGEFNQAGGQFL